ncbi:MULTISPECIES: glycoside hydrolase family 19 protein [Pseudomonas]|uniref:Glycoside hydrolase family 19 protein n=1 Tax=Pseudomonas putida TaxID=303 RepID=A0AAD0PF49_PSEPU|nr:MULTISPECIES: glycoside hydrolase family 19 protein [Pseudomonas]AXA25896.1 glycoside hydrolase family 19 protein [Pseudomonas putida]
MAVTEKQLQQILPNASRQAGVFVPALNATMGKYGIVGRQRMAAFIAQIGHESGQLRTLVESLNYRADRIRQIGQASPEGSRWRSLVPRADELAGKPERFANAAYGGRMGNRPEASGDGWLFRGRGLIQVTGRSNYAACSEALFGDSRLLNTPELLEHPVYAALSAGWFWQKEGLNSLADKGDLLAITKRINGGTSGFDGRKALYERALEVLQ